MAFDQNADSPPEYNHYLTWHGQAYRRYAPHRYSRRHDLPGYPDYSNPNLKLGSTRNYHRSNIIRSLLDPFSEPSSDEISNRLSSRSRGLPQHSRQSSSAPQSIHYSGNPMKNFHYSSNPPKKAVFCNDTTWEHQCHDKTADAKQHRVTSHRHTLMGAILCCCCLLPSDDKRQMKPLSRCDNVVGASLKGRTH